MSKSLPQSILFCCDHNAVRSPMAEGIMKKLFGTGTYVQSVGVINDLEIDLLIMSAANLSIYGWKKEAIPVVQTKNSLITRIFKSLFG